MSNEASKNSSTDEQSSVLLKEFRSAWRWTIHFAEAIFEDRLRQALDALIDAASETPSYSKEIALVNAIIAEFQTLAKKRPFKLGTALDSLRQRRKILGSIAISVEPKPRDELIAEVYRRAFGAQALVGRCPSLEVRCIENLFIGAHSYRDASQEQMVSIPRRRLELALMHTRRKTSDNVSFLQSAIIRIEKLREKKRNSPSLHSYGAVFEARGLEQALKILRATLNAFSKLKERATVAAMPMQMPPATPLRPAACSHGYGPGFCPWPRVECSSAPVHYTDRIYQSLTVDGRMFRAVLQRRNIMIQHADGGEPAPYWYWQIVDCGSEEMFNDH